MVGWRSSACLRRGTHWRKESLNKWCWENQAITHKRREPVYSNERFKPIMYREYHTGETDDVSIPDVFGNLTPKSREMKVKINNCFTLNGKAFLHQKQIQTE